MRYRPAPNKIVVLESKTLIDDTIQFPKEINRIRRGVVQEIGTGTPTHPMNLRPGMIVYYFVDEVSFTFRLVAKTFQVLGQDTILIYEEDKNA